MERCENAVSVPLDFIYVDGVIKGKERVEDADSWDITTMAKRRRGTKLYH